MIRRGTRRPGLPRAAVLAALPIVVVQGWGVRRRTPRLPDATDRRGRVEAVGGDPGATPWRVAVVGDSVAAGVGVPSHLDTVAGVCARRLAEETGRPAAWVVVARSGADSRQVAALVAADSAADPAGGALAGADVVVVSVGVNDTKNLRSDAAWEAGVRDLLEAVTAAAPGTPVLFLGLPPVEEFPALPAPLSWLLGGRARRLDDLAAAVAAPFPQVTRLSLTLGADVVAEPFAADGFHPGPELHALIADHAARLALAHTAAR